MKGRAGAKHSPFSTFGAPVPTRFTGLAYQRQGSHFRILDLSTGHAVGQRYRTRTALLDDLPRFAEQFGEKGGSQC
jgi:hypothetical protein